MPMPWHLSKTLAAAPGRAKAALAATLVALAAAPAAAQDMDLRVDLDRWEQSHEGLVALLFDDAPPGEAASLERVVRVPDRSPPENENPRLTLRVTDLEPGRYGLAVYPNEALGRMDLTGLGMPPTDRSLQGNARRRPRFQYALVRVTGSTLTVGLKMTY